MRTLLQDLRYALRAMAKSPGFTTVAVLTLALGIGANTAIFSVLDAVVLRPLPYPRPGRLAMLWERRPDRNHIVVSYPDFQDWRARSRSFESMAAYAEWTVNLTGIGQPERIESAVVSATFFKVLGVRPEAGRCASDRSLVGRPLLLDGKPYTVVGVAPAGIQLPSLAERTDLFIPVSHG